ncbi:FAD-binding domain-containing protein [Apiospora arundinis]|uniref:FAD-binding domain-containing protein n=1 Tax=Apiospora arundinis TaxID=335852 RepID=A0ABR2JGX3_9PEZI
MLPLASAAPSDSTKQACREIADRLPQGRVAYPLELPYIAETQRYWSVALRELRPACIVSPQCAEHVAAAVQVLSGHADVPFTVKSGGHDPNPGHSSIDDGVLIAMHEMVGATYDAKTGHALVKPAGEWNDVIGALEPHGVTVVGGRLGIVGVGGLLLQGGLSFLSAQYGLAADSIVGWETVMPNGTIVNVDAKAQPDLAVAMKGSGSQFGIVTQFTIEAHPIGQVWGGYRLYDASQKDALFAALHQFIPNNADDPKTAVIFSDLVTAANIPAVLMFYFHEGPEEPTSGPIRPFLDIPTLGGISSVTKTQSYAQLLKGNGDFSSAVQARDSFRTFTIPHVPNNPGLYDEISKKWHDITSAYLITHPTSQCSVDFQPLPRVVGSRTKARGGNAMGLTGSDPHRIVLEFQCGWLLKPDDAIVYALARDMTDWLQGRLPDWLAQAGLDSGAYMPLFMNDAAGDQNVTGSYRDHAKFKKLQESIDPMGVFAKRVGGYKY